MKFIIVFLFSILPFSLQYEKEFFSTNEQLIVFVQEINSEVSSTFKKDILPEIKKLAEEEKIEFILKNITDKAPKEITYTPAIAFRNNDGISFFNGRWNQITKVKNFIRGSRVMHQEKETNIRENEWVWKMDRIKIYAPIKITALEGYKPKKFNENSFLETARKGIEKGTVRFNQIKKLNASLSTRSFHLAFYPYRDKKGYYNITGEIYSQHNCIDPIYQHFEKPVRDKNLEKAFQKIAAILEEHIVHQIKNPSNGDGFDIVSASTKSIPWHSFGKIDHKNSIEEKENWANFNFKNKWKIAGPFAENTPMLFFKFAAPLDAYTGEVSKLNGELILEENKFDLKNAKGQFSIPITSITMGDIGLDEAIFNSILNSEKYPNAHFNFLEIMNASTPLNTETTSEVEIKGELILKGIKHPIITKGNIRPYLKNNKSYLHVQTRFNIDKSIFNVTKGPDGPESIKEQMQFYMNFLME